MLVVSRKLDERIFIGDSIVITVIDIDRGKIRLGIEAPRDVPTYREELLPDATKQAFAKRKEDASHARNAHPAADAPYAPATQHEAVRVPPQPDVPG